MKFAVLTVFVLVCFLKTCLLSNLKPKGAIYVITVLIIRGSALPAYFYEMLDDVEEASSETTQEEYKTTRAAEVLKPTQWTKETPIVDEWQLRGQYRLKCVDEIGVGPMKVVQPVSKNVTSWDDDIGMKKWMLCVLNKMGLMSMQGVFKMDVAMSKLRKRDRIDAESLIDHCLPKKQMEPHEIAWRYVKCHSEAKGNAAISVF